MQSWTTRLHALHAHCSAALCSSLSVCARCAGISLKTQFLYALVFLCRYVDLFWNFASMYNWTMKVSEGGGEGACECDTGAMATLQ